MNYMKKVCYFLVGMFGVGSITSALHAQHFDYPDTKRVDSVNVYHGTRVEAPYQWLENMDSRETRRWVKKQNQFTFNFLDKIPERKQIRKKLEKLWNYPKFGLPYREGGNLYYSRNSGLQDQSVVYMRPVGSDKKGEVLFNPNKWSKDGTVSLSGMSPGPNGRYVAYGKSKDGSDWKTLYIRDLRSGKDLEEKIKWVKFSGATWTKKGDGFYYGRYPKPRKEKKYKAQTKRQSVYYHELGTPQSTDTLVYERPDNPKLFFNTRVTNNGHYLLIEASEGTSEKSEIYIKDLRKKGSEIKPLIEGFDASYRTVGSYDDTLFVMTNKKAPNKRILSIDLDRPGRSNWKTVIPESDAIIQGAEIAGDKLLVESLADVKGRLRIYNMNGKGESTVPLPSIGSIRGVNGDPDYHTFYYGFTSFTYPSTVFRYNLRTKKSQIVHQPKIEGFKANRYRVRQIFYESTDGTKVPMFIVHKKGLELNGTHPTYLYGYGGFNITVTPGFSPKTLAWLKMGGIYAVPNLRGGGAYGESWHEAGKREHKQQVFDDFAAAARYLIENGYTNSNKLAIAGASNGGLLTGASITQHPNLFGAAIVERGVLDMLRYHKFTVGWAWVPEYGSAEKPRQFEFLYNYSPLHNIEKGTTYPPTLILTADTDDRVVPAHSYKFAAKLQNAQEGKAPILLRVETETGHGGGTPTSKEIEETADVLSFLVEVLNMHPDWL